MREPRSERPWLWGLILGLCVGGGVVLISSLRYGFSAPLLLLGLVLAVVFGGLALMSAFVSRRTHVD
jgi:hypothetical protein